MKLNFILKNKNNPTKIYCRFKPMQIYDFTCSAPLWINRDDWNLKQQQIKLKSENRNKDFINATLKKLETIVIDKWLIDTIERKDISKNWLKDILNDFFGQPQKNELHKIYFVDWIKKFIEQSPERIFKGKIISQLTIKQYQTTYNKIIAYEKYKNTKIKLENIDLDFHGNFIFYCKTIENLGNNSIGGHIKNIKMWCKNIEIEGYKINKQHRHNSFSTVQNPTYDIYLTETEVNQIFDYDFSYDNRLLNARNWFIIGLRTGLRISDFLSRLENINVGNNKISLITKKTDASVIIPIHPQIEAIYSANDFELPNRISDQKFNLYIKEICLIVGLKQMVFGSKMNSETKRKENGHFEKWELVTSHICRRTFATLLYGKLPNKAIMAITTHTTETQFLKYIKTTNEEFANILDEHWKNENKNLKNV
jgi:integrase